MLLTRYLAHLFVGAHKASPPVTLARLAASHIIPVRRIAEPQGRAGITWLRPVARAG